MNFIMLLGTPARLDIEAQEAAIKRAVERIPFAISPVEDEDGNS